MSDDKPIIIVKKKGGHGGHHGGAWKVAYADFVTAMMAFFMVMWLVNSADTVTKSSIASYFKRPGLFQQGSGTPLQIGQSGILEDAYVPAKKLRKGTYKITRPQERDGISGGIDIEVEKQRAENKDKDPEEYFGKKKPIASKMPVESEQEAATGDGKKKGIGDKDGGALDLEKLRFEQVAKEIKTLVKTSPELQELIGVVDVKLENDGLNIEIIDTQKTSMFSLGSAKILSEAEAAFAKIARIMEKLPNKVDVVGHTDAKPFSTVRGGYSNWELSADRANAARRALELNGISKDRVTSVVGAADRLLRLPDKPLDAANRRITLKMRFEKQSKDIDRKVFGKNSDITVIEPPVTEEPVHTFTPQEILLDRPPAKVEPVPVVPVKPKPKRLKKPEKKEKKSDYENMDERPDIYRPRRLIKATEVETKKHIVLPEEQEPITSNPEYIQKDKIFGNSPVFGPQDPLGGLE